MVKYLCMSERPYRKLSHRLLDELLTVYEVPNKQQRRVNAAIFFAIITPAFVLAAFTYFQINGDLNEFALRRREAVAYLSSNLLRAHFDHLSDLGKNFADARTVRTAVSAGQWGEATLAIVEASKSEPAFDRVVLVDTKGIIKADSLAHLGAIGTDLSFSQWFQVVSHSWMPYISDVYAKSKDADAESIISVINPIVSDSGEQLGFVVLDVRLETLLEWSKKIDAGPEAFVIITDRKGLLAVHPHLMVQSEVVHYFAFPPVQKALNLERGVELLYDPTIRTDVTAAYEPVQRYGWTVVVEQPVVAALSLVNSNISLLLGVYLLLLLLSAFTAFVVMRAIAVISGLRRREKSYLNSLGEGVMVTDETETIVLANPAAASMLGRFPSEMIGSHSGEVLSIKGEHGVTILQDDLPVAQALLGHRISAKYQLKKKDGMAFPASVTATPVLIDGRRGAVLVFRDITKDEELDRAKREFISIASHQLLTPVAAAKSFLAMLVAGDFGQVTSQQKEYLGKLYELNQRMIELVDDLLNVSRLELGVIETATEAVNIIDFMHAEIESIRPLALAKDIRLVEAYDSGFPEVPIPQKLLKIVVQNLVSNAIKYTPNGGSVTIGLTRTSNEEGRSEARLSVTDTGYGIPEAQKGKIFAKFFRADNVRRVGIDGTGLGLFIVRAVIELLRGKVWFESTEGKGTTFFASFPLVTRKSVQ